MCVCMCVTEIYIYTFSNKPVKSEDQFTYLANNISATENVNIYIAKECSAIGRLFILWKYDLSDKAELFELELFD